MDGGYERDREISTYGSFRDGGETSEKGISVFLAQTNPNASSGGVIGTGDFLVSERSAGANKSVDIAIGYILFDEGIYTRPAWSDAVENVTITDNSSGNPRIDAIYAYYDESVVSSASSDNPNVLKFAALAGTPASTPSAPSDAEIQSDAGSGNPYMRLADVDVANGFSSTVDADIEDRRDFSRTYDAIRMDYDTNPERIVSGLLFAVPGSGLTATASIGYGYVRGYYVRKDQTEDHLFTASKDTYVDIDKAGEYQYSEVALSAAEPAVASNSIRCCKVVTDATDVIIVTDLRNYYTGGDVSATGDLNLTSSWQDISGTSITFEVSQASVLSINARFNLRPDGGTASANTGDVLQGDVDLDGTKISIANYEANANDTITCISIPMIKSLTAASHTIKMQAKNNAGNRGYVDAISAESTSFTGYTYQIYPGFSANV